MTTIPAQSAGKDVCSNCGEVIHLVNRAVEPVWVHDDTGIEWCPLRAVPASRPWPERAVI